MSQEEHREVERYVAERAGLLTAEHRTHIGPLPDQDWLSAVEAIHPGATAIILRDYTEEHQHQRRVEEREIGLDAESFSAFNRYQRSRLWVAGGIAVFLASGGLALMLLDKAIYGFVLLIAEITSLAAVFLVLEAMADDGLDELDAEESGGPLGELDEGAG
jgi:hypothetical protein